MRRISAAWKGAAQNHAILAPPPPPKGGSEQTHIKPPPTDSWVVDEHFLEECSLLIPASPDDVDDVTRQILFTRAFKKPNEWVDSDKVMYELGSALDVFPSSATFDSLKWVFVSVCTLAQMCVWTNSFKVDG
jgi:hypothetical protein